MKYIVATAALAAVSSAATVTLKTTPCLQDYPLEEFTIDTNKLAVHDLQTVCGLKIVSATGVDASSLTCLAYKDAAGTQPGSAYFTSTDPALIATNPVQEAAVRCDENGKPPLSNGNNATASVVGTVTSVTFVTLPTGTAGTTANTAVSSGAIPTPSGTNSTGPSSAGTPTQPSVAPPTNTDSGASLATLSMGAVFAGLMALLL